MIYRLDEGRHWILCRLVGHRIRRAGNGKNNLRVSLIAEYRGYPSPILIGEFENRAAAETQWAAMKAEEERG